MDELRKKIDLAMSETLVGNYVFTDNETMKMFSYANTVLRSYEYRGVHISIFDYNLLFVAMVNATKKWNAEEECFWDNIARILFGTTDSLPHKTYRFLTDLIARLGLTGKILYLDGCTKKYYATLLAHAYAPFKSTQSFLELCWEIYCEDLNQSYIEDDDEFYMFVAEQMKSLFGLDVNLDDDMQLGSHVYSLRAGIKRLAIDKTNVMSQFIKQTISAIHSVSLGCAIERGYYNSLIKDWYKEKEKSFGREYREKRTIVKSVSDYKTIAPKYCFEAGRVLLRIPSIRLKDNYNYCPILEISVNGKIVSQEDMLTRGSGLSMATKELDVRVEELDLSTAINIEISITHCGQLLYDSGKSLFRDFIFFKDSKEVGAQECLPGNYHLFCKDLDSLQYPSELKQCKACLYVFISQEGEVLQSSNRTVIFVTEKQNYEAFIYAPKKRDILYRQNGREYDVIDGDLTVRLQSGANLNDYGVRYEDTSFKLIEFSHSYDEKQLCFNISQLLLSCEPQQITLFKYSTNKIVSSVSIVRFNKVSVTFDKPYYYDKQSHGTVEFLTDSIQKTVSFSLKQGEISIPLIKGEIIVNPPTIKWKIGENDWNTQFNDRLWFKDFNNSSLLYVDTPVTLSYSVCLNNTYLSRNNNISAYYLGQSVFSSLTQDCFVLFLRLENGERIPLATIYTREMFLQSPFLLFARYKLFWNPMNCYVGSNLDKFKVLLESTSGEQKEFELDLKSTQIDLNGVEDGYYNLSVELEQIGFLKKQRQLLVEKICIGNENELRFKNKILCITKVMLYGAVELKTIKKFYIDSIQFICENEGRTYYSGNIFITNKEGNKTYLNSMKNRYGTWDKINPVMFELRTADTCWMVAGANRNDILDFLGELFLDRFDQISNMDNGKQIDFYYFEKR